MKETQRSERSDFARIADALEALVRSNWAILQQQKRRELPALWWLAIGAVIAMTIGPSLVLLFR